MDGDGLPARDPAMDKELLKVFRMYRKVARTLGHPCVHSKSSYLDSLDIDCMSNDIYATRFCVASVLSELTEAAFLKPEGVPLRLATCPTEWDRSRLDFLRKINYTTMLQLGHKWPKAWALRIVKACPLHMRHYNYLWDERQQRVKTREMYDHQYRDEQELSEWVAAGTEVLRTLWKEKAVHLRYDLKLWDAELRMRKVYGEPPEVDETWVEPLKEYAL